MDIQQLLRNYREGKMNASEKAAFEELLHGEASEQLLQQMVDDSLQHIPPVEAEETQKYLYQQIVNKHIKHKPGAAFTGIVRSIQPSMLGSKKYAAVLLLALGAAAYFFYSGRKQLQDAPAAGFVAVKADLPPGHAGAVLTLANGQKVLLDSLADGVIASQNGTQVVLKGGEVSYASGTKKDSEVLYNTMSTPKGRQFQLSLPDGSKVWLNAASSIRYPTVFTGKERLVEIEGEVYFEVAKNAQMPFRVTINKSTDVEVLGTSFNINAYEDAGGVTTTLLEGKVKIETASGQKIMRPGEQAVVGKTKDISISNDANIDQVMAWKNGLFNFDGYDIKSVMRELARWYDLDVVYEYEPEPEEMMGEIQRELNLSQVMKILEKLQIKYRLEGRKLTIMK